MALGTPLDGLFYFYVPGFGQSGSPGRALVLWTFGMACIAGVGLDGLWERIRNPRPKQRLAYQFSPSSQL